MKIGYTPNTFEEPNRNLSEIKLLLKRRSNKPAGTARCPKLFLPSSPENSPRAWSRIIRRPVRAKNRRRERHVETSGRLCSTSCPTLCTGTVGPSAWGPDVPFFPSFVDASAVLRVLLVGHSAGCLSTYRARERAQWRRINCGWVLGAPPHGRDPLCSPGRGFPYQHARRVQVWVHRVQECHTERRGCAATIGHRHQLSRGT